MRPIGLRLSITGVAGVRLDDEPGSVGGERIPDMPSCPERVAHVVQAVERGHQVVTDPVKVCGADFERDLVRNTQRRRLGAVTRRSIRGGSPNRQWSSRW